MGCTHPSSFCGGGGGRLKEPPLSGMHWACCLLPRAGRAEGAEMTFSPRAWLSTQRAFLLRSGWVLNIIKLFGEKMLLSCLFQHKKGLVTVVCVGEETTLSSEGKTGFSR